MYLLCCIFRIVKIKELANIVAAALLCCAETFMPQSEAKLNGYPHSQNCPDEYQKENNSKINSEQLETGKLQLTIPNSSSASHSNPEDTIHNCGGPQFALR